MPILTKTFKKYGVYREIKTTKYVDFHTYRYSSIILAGLRYLYELSQNRLTVQFKIFKKAPTVDLNLIDNIEIDGIDFADYPDFVDAFISSATYNGRPATDSELDVINEDKSFVYEQVLRKIY